MDKRKRNGEISRSVCSWWQTAREHMGENAAVLLALIFISYHSQSVTHLCNDKPLNIDINKDREVERLIIETTN